MLKNKEQMTKRTKYPGVMPPFKRPTLIIRYDFHWGGQLADRWMWVATWSHTGSVEDYHSKDTLISHAIENGYEYAVIRIHRKENKCSIVQTNIPKCDLPKHSNQTD